MLALFKLFLDTHTIFNLLEFKLIILNKMSLMMMKNISKSFQKIRFT